MQAVWRNQSMKMSRPRNGFVTFVGLAVRVVIAKRCEVAWAATPYEVVFFRAVEVDDAEFRLSPVKPVVTLGIRCHGAALLLSKCRRIDAIPRTELVALFERNHVRYTVSFPWMFRLDGNFAAHRRMQYLPHVVHAGDQITPDKQLAT